MMFKIKILPIIICVITLVSCTTKFQDTGTSTSVSQMLTNEWHIKSYDPSKPVLIDNEFEMRVSTYSSPFFIHQQWVEQVASPYKKLQGLCRRQNGQFTYLGDNNAVMINAGLVKNGQPLPPPDQLTIEVLIQIRNSKWIGDYSCSSSTENWRASIKATNWRAKNDGTNAWRYITTTTKISINQKH
ncbi:hypothetical protein [Acinetobacter haemolyticus]|uniref:hypothetical protein n=2 Tax=Acinetobacter TaxID=469 RepID=UPI0024DE4C92|nr:hypothetical protein [Acinetobacter haemolyticus]